MKRSLLSTETGNILVILAELHVEVFPKVLLFSKDDSTRVGHERDGSICNLLLLLSL